MSAQLQITAKRCPVELAEPNLADISDMGSRPVPLMHLKSIRRVLVGEAPHQPIARNLCHDGC